MSAAGMEGMALGAGRALSEDSDDDGGGIKWEVASEASSDEAGEPHDVELPQEETLAPKPKKKPSRADVAEKRRLRGEKKEWRSRRVVVHQAQLVVFVARLRLLDSACDAEAARDAAVALLPGHLLQRLRAAARGESRAQLVGAVNGISKAAKAAVLEPSSKDRKRWRDTWGAAPAGLAARAISTRTASPAELAQLVCAACRACEVETRLVAGISPVVCAQSHASGCDVTAWLEVRLPPRRGASAVDGSEAAWTSVDPSLDVICAPIELFSRSKHRTSYAVAAAPGGALVDVSEVYGCDLKIAHLPSTHAHWWPAALEAMGGSVAAPSQTRAPLPTNKHAFASHKSFALESTLSKRERLRPASRGVAWFRGERVFARSAVEILRTEKNWLRQFRKVRPNETPSGRIEAAAERDAMPDPERDAQLDLFSETQTEAWAPDAVLDRIIPTNDHGNVDLVDGDERLVPRGAVWVRGEDARNAARVLRLEHADALVGFEFACKKPATPKFDGVVCLVEDVEALRRAVSHRVEAAAESERNKRRAKYSARWGALVRKVLTRERLRDEYG